LISISDQQRCALPDANWFGTVYHGISPEIYRPNARPGGDYGGLPRPNCPGKNALIEPSTLRSGPAFR
jgi:hypothetical protein